MAKMTYIKAITNDLTKYYKTIRRLLFLVKMLVKTVVCSVPLKDCKTNMVKIEYSIPHLQNQEF
jgi:hypothetical protein